MHIEFLVEEPSAEVALHNLVPKIVGLEVSYNIHVFQGKPDLIKSLPNRLRGYRSWLPDNWRIVVLVDAGYYRGGLPKKEAARRISEHMDPTRNTSKSFQVFRNALQELVI